MKVIFADGRWMQCNSVHSMPMTYDGTTRDSYTFLFPADTSIDTIKNHFTPDNCDQITLEDEDGNRFIHEHYTIPISAGTSDRGLLLMAGENVDHEQVPYIKMCRETTMETRVRQLQEVTDAVLTNMLEG